MPDFVGTGWAFPMGVSPSGGIAMVSRVREIEEAMRIILLTYPGERPMRPQFGSRVRDYVFRNADWDTASQLSLEVSNALMRWEPRVDVLAVNVYPDADTRDRMLIDIVYQIKAENDRRNLVFPFYTIPDDGSDY